MDLHSVQVSVLCVLCVCHFVSYLCICLLVCLSVRRYVGVFPHRRLCVWVVERGGGGREGVLDFSFAPTLKCATSELSARSALHLSDRESSWCHECVCGSWCVGLRVGRNLLSNGFRSRCGLRWHLKGPGAFLVPKLVRLALCAVRCFAPSCVCVVRNSNSIPVP